MNKVGNGCQCFKCEALVSYTIEQSRKAGGRGSFFKSQLRIVKEQNEFLLLTPRCTTDQSSRLKLTWSHMRAWDNLAHDTN